MTPLLDLMLFEGFVSDVVLPTFEQGDEIKAQELLTVVYQKFDRDYSLLKYIQNYKAIGTAYFYMSSYDIFTYDIDIRDKIVKAGFYCISKAIDIQHDPMDRFIRLSLLATYKNELAHIIVAAIEPELLFQICQNPLSPIATMPMFMHANKYFYCIANQDFKIVNHPEFYIDELSNLYQSIQHMDIPNPELASSYVQKILSHLEEEFKLTNDEVF